MDYVATWERDTFREGEMRGEIRGERRGEREGIKKGEIKGIREDKKLIAGNMIKKGFDLDTIMEITGLDKKAIKRLMAKTH